MPCTFMTALSRSCEWDTLAPWRGFFFSSSSPSLPSRCEPAKLACITRPDHDIGCYPVHQHLSAASLVHCPRACSARGRVARVHLPHAVDAFDVAQAHRADDEPAAHLHPQPTSVGQLSRNGQ